MVLVGRSLIPLDERLVALLLVLLLILVLLLGSFCPLCLGQQRLSKSSSAAVADDDGDEDGNLKQCRTLASVLQHHLSAARAWQVGSASRERERERERVPAGRVLISRLPNNTKKSKDLACRLIDTSPL